MWCETGEARQTRKNLARSKLDERSARALPRRFAFLPTDTIYNNCPSLNE